MGACLSKPKSGHLGRPPDDTGPKARLVPDVVYSKPPEVDFLLFNV